MLSLYGTLTKVKSVLFVSACSGYGPTGEQIIRLFNSERIEAPDGKLVPRKYIAFDLDPNVVVKNFREGKRVLYGDGSQPLVLRTAGVENPKVIMVTYDDKHERFGAVQRLHEAFPESAIITRASGEEERVQLLDSGASIVCCDEREAGLRLAGTLLSTVGFDRVEISRLCREDREQSELQDVRIMEDSRARRVDSQATFISSSGIRFNSPDDRNNFALKFVNLAKSKIAGIIGSRSADDDDFGESQYAAADKKLQIKDPSAMSNPTVDALEAAGGIDGVDFCKLPSSETESSRNVNVTQDTSSVNGS